MAEVYRFDDPKVAALQNGTRQWWDVTEEKSIKAVTLYLAQGCPDWGERSGPPHNLCTFCALPHAARAYREEFFGGRPLLPAEHVGIFEANLKHLAPATGDVHTLFVFNAGSFLAEQANPLAVQERVVGLVAEHPTLRRLVIESRAGLITPTALDRLTSILQSGGKSLTVRIGVETQDDHLRLKVLRKGHSRQELAAAVRMMRDRGVSSGGYALLNPAPGLDPSWAVQEANRTIGWILKGLGMDEVYFGPTCVGPGTPLEAEWRAGRFQPASLWAVLEVLSQVARRYNTRVHLLPFRDEPPFVAVSSNHVPEGIPETLEGARGCDLAFHQMLQNYRETMNATILDSPPVCSCRPDGLID